MLIIIDYGMGNLGSIKRKFSLLGVDAVISSNQFEIINADKLILPGVGHFQKAVENLKQYQLWDLLNEIVLVKKTPILGICLGMQLMAKHSEEGDVEGFGWFEAEVVKIKVKDRLKYKVPHIGWNQISILKKDSKIFKDIQDKENFYFVHSFSTICENPSIISSITDYGVELTASIEKDNIFALQFHPEKSSLKGIKILENFLDIVQEEG